MGVHDGGYHVEVDLGGQKVGSTLEIGAHDFETGLDPDGAWPNDLTILRVCLQESGVFRPMELAAPGAKDAVRIGAISLEEG